MTTAPWIQVEPSLRMRSEPRQGLQLTLFVPPHEVPQAVRGEFDKQLKKFVIEIRYLDDEDFKRETMDDTVCLRIGKNSRRLLGIELDTANLNVAQVQFQLKEVEEEIKRAVTKFLQKDQAQEERENYALAIKAIESKGEQLLNRSILAPAL
ncbi:MAG: hypothetical protein KGM96_15665 [Acidobacteriota bacterium]|nr:hypothetical protein [Acidobacteriota bacterium]